MWFVAVCSCNSWLVGQTVTTVFVCAVNDVEESEGLPSLDKPGWYSQGNWPHLHELLKNMTGKPEPKVHRPPRTLEEQAARALAEGHIWHALRLAPAAYLAEAERDGGFMINRLREIHTSLMKRRNVGPGTSVGRAAF